MQGKIEIHLNNRDDGTPILRLMAKDKQGQKTLSRIHGDLGKVRLLAITKGKADIHNVCGSSEDENGVLSLAIPMALGGADILCLEKECKKCMGKCQKK